MASKPAMLTPHNQTKHSSSRVTKEGKNITYELEVKQWPDRARACGAGAKSSADRRPVDPPPVVQIRVYESDSNGLNNTDITFSYNANFFLFATLEFARPVAHGRVQGQPTFPVLTGAAVAGIAYLSRPSPAGYFIFPDLSVRHEGYYRLNFHLYEEVKDNKDQDKNWVPPRPNTSRNPMHPGPPQQFMHFRLDVKSEPFTVYSAKKFPGLRESTHLSQEVASQGCRVRIRRDVRMRRREEKAMEKYGGFENGNMTPDPYPGTPVTRPRSTSNASVDGYGYCTPQHPSMHPEVPHYPGQPYQLPPPSHSSSAGGGSQSQQQPHLTFGAEQYCSQPAQPPPPPPPQQQPQQPMSRTAYPPHYPGYPHSRQVSTGGGSDYAPAQPVAQQHPQYQPESTPRPQSQRSNTSRASLPSLMSPAPLDTAAAAAYATRPADYQRWSSESRSGVGYGQNTPRSSAPVSPSPAMPHTLAADPRSGLKHPHSSNGGGPGLDGSAVYGPPAIPGPKSYTIGSMLSSKRGHGDVFDNSHHDQPLYDGQRPRELPSPRQSYRENLKDDGALVYSRANGETWSKPDRTTKV